MYTNLINVQIIISLLKQYNIKHLVLSPGTRNAPLVHSIETDPFFTCYSIVDERSAAYFALGLSEAIGEPVGFSCTSSTAACNYLPAIQEAYERKIPLIALTADRDWRRLYQMEDQMIDQVNMYTGYVKKSVNLPIVKDSDDVWFCERSVNEALLELERAETGPIQINFQVSNMGDYSVQELPKYRKINRIRNIDSLEIEEYYRSELKAKSKILVICGQHYSAASNLKEQLEIFSDKYNAVVSYDYFSNIQSDRFLKTVLVTEAMDSRELEEYLPDLVITIGLHVWSFIKYKLQRYAGKFEHWSVSPNGEIKDGLKSLTNIFECEPEIFFQKMNNTNSVTDGIGYYDLWKKRIDTVKYPDFGFTNFYIISEFTKRIPKDSLLHLSILNAVRLTNFNTIPEPVITFGNLGADGIDGALSTFLGQSSVHEKLSFLVIGDLSFMYDLNATLMNLRSNQRILLINNFAGAEFHTNFGLEKMPTLNQHIAASHSTRFADWVEMMNVDYLSARNPQELDVALTQFVKPDNRPILLEVFTDADTDAKTLKAFYALNRRQENQA